MKGVVSRASNGMSVGNIVVHVPDGGNWMHKDSTKNPVSRGRIVKITSLYHDGESATITPISGDGAGVHYVCGISDLAFKKAYDKPVYEKDRIIPKIIRAEKGAY